MAGGRPGRSIVGRPTGLWGCRKSDLRVRRKGPAELSTGFRRPPTVRLGPGLRAGGRLPAGRRRASVALLPVNRAHRAQIRPESDLFLRSHLSTGHTSRPSSSALYFGQRHLLQLKFPTYFRRRRLIRARLNLAADRRRRRRQPPRLRRQRGHLRPLRSRSEGKRATETCTGSPPAGPLSLPRRPAQVSIAKILDRFASGRHPPLCEYQYLDSQVILQVIVFPWLTLAQNLFPPV